MNENLYKKNKHEPIFVVTDENLKNCKTSEDALKRLEKATRKRMKEDEEYEYKCIADLEEENKDLKAYNEKLLNGDIDKHNKIVELKIENAKLKEKIEHLTKHLDYQDICDLFEQIEEEVAQEQRIKNIEKENAELKTLIKNEHEIETRKNNNLISKLTEAKEIIKKFSEFANNEVEYDTEHPQGHTDLWNKLCEKAEKFLEEGICQ